MSEKDGLFRQPDGKLYNVATEDGIVAFHAANDDDARIKIEVMSLGDREMCVVAVSELEGLVQRLLSECLIDDKKQQKELMKTIEGFISQARLIYLMGLIPKEFFWLLDILAQIRNKFAHNNRVRTLQDITDLYPKLLEKYKSVIDISLVNSAEDDSYKFWIQRLENSFRETFQQAFITADIGLRNRLEQIKSAKAQINSREIQDK